MDADTQARHDANRASLVEVREALVAQYEAEDLATANLRKEALAKIDTGLAHHDAMVANDGVMPSAEVLNRPADEPVMEPESPAVVAAETAPTPPHETFIQRMEDDVGIRHAPPEPAPAPTPAPAVSAAPTPPSPIVP
jgi:hypothetical protein